MISLTMNELTLGEAIAHQSKKPESGQVIEHTQCPKGTVENDIDALMGPDIARSTPGSLPSSS